ncbi:unnamed protein product [Adineta ricciae]|uniref:Uncharacterized protein n=1 Tax=Adineta ricciae TaxID=249248 RepID=A0A813N1G6_ADIRI|nr:unnamed protein product [Adineta ricciae]
MNLIMTTPDEFLQFAKEMGLGRIQSTPIQTVANYHEPSTTGLCVLNNLCCLIEQIRQLKAENNRLRAHLEIDRQLNKFRQFLISKENSEDKKDVLPSKTLSNEEKTSTLSPTNSLKLKRSKLIEEPKSIHYTNQQEDSPPSILTAGHELLDLTENNSGSVPTSSWNKVRHAFRFSLRRKHDHTTSPPLAHVDRQIPTISVSIESDDDHLKDNKRLKKKKKKNPTVDENQSTIIGDDSDPDDQSVQLVRAYHRRRLYGNDTATSSSTERQEASSITLRSTTSNNDEETLLKPRYRRKIRSKLDTVRRQFSDQNSSTSARAIHQSHGTTFDDIGSGLNHALLTAQLAPALTKSYQQKMREWESMQKSHFLVSYRRQSIVPKSDPNSNSRKPSLIHLLNQTTTNEITPSTIADFYPITIEESNIELPTNIVPLGPILSPNQRSLIVHQWREIMSEELLLRHCQEYLQQKTILLKELKTNLKTLKTSIFCTTNSTKTQSMADIRENYHKQEQLYLPQRCHSLQTLISMPASWILAVQSAAYSDVLDGTSNQTTERAILCNKNFFDQLEQCKRNRQEFEQDSLRNSLQTKPRQNVPANCNENSHHRPVPHRAYLRKLSLIESSEFPGHFLPHPVIPLQSTLSEEPPPANVEHNSITSVTDTNSTPNPNEKDSPPTTNHSRKRSKRSRFDFRETFDRSRSLCIAQINLWLQRRRQIHISTQRRKSTTESKISTPKLLGSPRLARLHRRLFKNPTTSSPSPLPDQTSALEPLLDDSDNQSLGDLPVRIYFPPLSAPVTRRVRITDINTIIYSHDSYDDDEEEVFEQISQPKVSSDDNRKHPFRSSTISSSYKIATAKERRESYATLSTVFNNRCL